MGVEPIHVGFADQCLPTWLLRRCRQYGISCAMLCIEGENLVAVWRIVNRK